MTSMLQKKSNRRNALKSTGPKTCEGKAVSSKNAISHGLLSRDLIISNESREDLESFQCKVYQTLCPQGAVEELLVDKIVNVVWRLRRLTKIEGELLTEDTFVFGETSLSQGFKGSNGHSIQVLSRYESTLERSFYRAMHELQRVQGMRLGQHVLAPVAIDVCSDMSRDEIGFDS